MPIHGIFYARFLPQEGTKIVAQSPPGCIVPVAAADESDDDDFDPMHWPGSPGRADGADTDGLAARTAGLDLNQGASDDAGSDAGSDADSDSESGSGSADDTLEFKSRPRARAAKKKHASKARPRAGSGSDIAPSDNDVRLAGGDSDTGSAATKRTRSAAASASASAMLGTAASVSSSSVLRRARPLKPPLFDFDVMAEYVIPKPAFFNCYLASRDPSGKYAVLGLPVAIRDPKYDRNEFIFNFGIVVDAATDDQGPYERVVRRLASTFAEMEKQNEFLSREEQRQREKGSQGLGGLGGLGDALAAAAAAEGVSSTSNLSNPSNPSNLSNFSAGPLKHINSGFSTHAFSTTLADHNGHSPYHRRSIQSLLEIIKEDLNLYGECMIPVDDANTINMKLFPIHPNPPAVEGWHVPVPKMRLASIVDPTWDLTLQRVIAHMDGVSDVRRIAFEADISIELCRSALRHLLYYDTILLLDLFFFGSCYAPRPGIHDFVANAGGIVDECARYVCLDRHDDDAPLAGSTKTAGKAGKAGKAPKSPRRNPFAGRPRRPSRTKGTLHDDHDHDHDHDPNDADDNDSDDSNDSDSDRSLSSSSPYHRPARVSNFDLVRLMTSFCVGRTVAEWLKGHADAGFDVLRFVDVRRLVQFGVIKGCLYRVHKYVVSKQYLASLATGVSAPPGAAPNTASHTASHAYAQRSGDPLQRYTDGQHHFDQIMTEQNLTETELINRLKRMPLPQGDLMVLYR